MRKSRGVFRPNPVEPETSGASVASIVIEHAGPPPPSLVGVVDMSSIGRRSLLSLPLLILGTSQMTTLTAQAATIGVSGSWTPKFEGVVRAFETNLRDHGEVGAAFSLVVGGETVVDIWGGWRDGARTQRWDRDTIVNVWSSTKGLNATCFAMLVDRGLIAYSDPVSRYWPEFAAAGKAEITIGMLLSHQAGLCGFTTPARVEDLYGGEVAAARLVAQAPLWPPGTASGYHAISMGVLSPALFRRIEGRSITEFVAQEIAGPFKLDIAIGLPASDVSRAAEMLAPASMSTANVGAGTPAQFAAMRNPPLSPLLPNSTGWRAAELPSANGFSNARALAGLYGNLLPSRSGARRLISPETLAKATAPQIEGIDLVLGGPSRWAAGFLLNAHGVYGPNPNAFGHSGWGGSFGFADPKAGLAAGYSMNQMGEQLQGDPRAMSLIEAVYAAL